jgi:hypothetical protein
MHAVAAIYSDTTVIYDHKILTEMTTGACSIKHYRIAIYGKLTDYLVS